MPEKFAREKHVVELLMQRLGTLASQYIDPNAEAGQETGVDVIAVTATGRVGIQVTELDTGDVPGQSRGEEKKAARAAGSLSGGVYGAWAQNNPAKLLKAVERTIARKSTMTPVAGFEEVWLLISCGVPELGAVSSTFVMTPWLDAVALNNATLDQLSKSKYGRAFIHAVLSVEQTLYQWSSLSGSWNKTTQPESLGTQGPSFFDVIKDPEWIKDPEGKFNREVETVLREIREGKLS